MSERAHWRVTTAVVTAWPVILLVGCTVGPNFTRPATPRIKHYTQTPLPKQTVSVAGIGEGAAQHFVAGGAIPRQWWKLFHSRSLNALVDSALKANPTLQSAQASLREARENYLASTGSLYPALGANFQGTRQKTSGALFGRPNEPHSIYTLYNAQANVSYTLDLFGGTRRQIEQNRAAVDYSRFQLEGTYLSLSTNVVTAAIQVASLRTQLAVTHSIVDAQLNIVDIVRRQLRLGGASEAQLQQQLAQLAQDRAQLPPLRKKLAQTEHELAVLTGHFPSQVHPLTVNLNEIHLPRRLPVSVPSHLVQQRPDVRAAEAQLHEASAAIGVATANMLPQITLSGDVGSLATRASNLFSPGGGIWTITGGLLQPIFQGGALVHKRRAAVAAYDRAAADYRETVLLAFENVADVLRNLTDDAEALQAQQGAERAARRSYDIALRQYQAGGIGYPTLLQAVLTYQQSRVALAQARAARLSDTAALFEALGGGWWNRNHVTTADSKVETVSKN